MHDVDVLLTGCEVSLWLAEQFAADLSMVTLAHARPHESILATHSHHMCTHALTHARIGVCMCAHTHAHAIWTEGRTDGPTAQDRTDGADGLRGGWQVFPALKVQAVSANKLLGTLGQNFPAMQAGFVMSDDSSVFKDSITIIISHSGGTFASLAVANLLKSFTSNIFTVSSEWDTQVPEFVEHNPIDLVP